tara:strand:+ start:1685 stop:3103 length:1419 start_codon:yes stop_codon:yes gene_type:complete
MSVRVFTEEEVCLFAQISGDYNPAHLDPVFARKTIFGEVAVHGVFVALKALDDSFSDILGSVFIKDLRIRFKKPIRLAKKYEIKVEKTKKTQWEIRVFSINELCISLVLQFEETEPSQKKATQVNDYNLSRIPKICDPLSKVGLAGSVSPHSFDTDLIAKLFPNLASHFSQDQIVTIMATSRLVGMEYPGLHSVFLELQLNFDEGYSQQEKNDLRYKVTYTHPITSHTKIEVSNDHAKGIVKAAFRPKPVSSIKTSELKKQIHTHEFSDMRALVVGGSRGLGALATKLIVAGGGNVLFSYAKGSDDAVELLDDLKSSVSGCGNSFHYDVYEAEDIVGLIGDFMPTHLLYFATPRIAIADGIGFDKELFNRYNLFYVQRFGEIVSSLERINPNLSVFYPSSVFLSEIVTKASEYASSKAAGEMYCKHLEKINPSMKIYISRLPRLETDQTSSIVPIETKDKVQEILKIIKEIA